jgi:hypothetical protein
MQHRHLNHQDFTLAAIDDVIGRGRLPDWDALRSALLSQPAIRASSDSSRRSTYRAARPSVSVSRNATMSLMSPSLIAG